MFVPTAVGAIAEDRQAAEDGADHLLETQLDSGAFPWDVDSTGEHQNVQGVTAQGLLDAYKATANDTYLEAAGETVDWLASYYEANPDAYTSAPNTYFLAEYALLTQNLTALDLAREAFERALEDRTEERWEPHNATDMAETILEARESHGIPNYGLWDVALFTRAAQDIGNTSAADELASVLVEQAREQTIVDPYDDTAFSYGIGLAGLLFGLAESDVVGHQAVIEDASAALKAEQEDDGFVSSGIYGGLQATSYAALGFVAVGELQAAHDACDWLAEDQLDDGSWTTTPIWADEPQEYAETDSEAVQALSTCTLPARNGAQAYSDAAVGFVPSS